MYTQQLEIFVIAMINIPSHIGSSQMDTLVSQQLYSHVIMATFTKPRFSQLAYKLCSFTFL